MAKPGYSLVHFLSIIYDTPFLLSLHMLSLNPGFCNLQSSHGCCSLLIFLLSIMLQVLIPAIHPNISLTPNPSHFIFPPKIIPLQWSLLPTTLRRQTNQLTLQDTLASISIFLIYFVYFNIILVVILHKVGAFYLLFFFLYVFATEYLFMLFFPVMSLNVLPKNLCLNSKPRYLQI